MRTPRRVSAFSLVELLVVVAITCVMMGMFLPAVQRVRDSASTLQCSNHFRQMGIAIHNYHEAHGCVPATAFYGDAQLHRMLLPYVEQTPQEIDMGGWTWVDYNSIVVPIYFCPTRRAPSPGHTDHGYAANGTMELPEHMGVLEAPWDSVTTMKHLADGDGAANTIMLSHKSMPAMELGFGDGCGGDYLIRNAAVLPTRDTMVDNPDGFGSTHAGAMPHLFADGSVRMLAYGLSATSLFWQHLWSFNDGNVVNTGE